MTGKIARIVSDKGFGFIKGDDEQDYFFHRTGVQGSAFEDLRMNATVTFEVGRGPKGPRAENIRVAG